MDLKIGCAADGWLSVAQLNYCLFLKVITDINYKIFVLNEHQGPNFKSNCLKDLLGHICLEFH